MNININVSLKVNGKMETQFDAVWSFRNAELVFDVYIFFIRFFSRRESHGMKIAI